MVSANRESAAATSRQEDGHCLYQAFLDSCGGGSAPGAGTSRPQGVGRDTMPTISKPSWAGSAGLLFFGLALGLGTPSSANAQPFPTCDSSPGKICTMTIRIFNDSPNHFIYPVLTTGKGPVDIWMQAWFGLTQTVVDAGTNPYPRNKNYRLYINPAKGIAPGTGITVTLPLYTKIDNSINSGPSTCDPNKVTCTDTFIDWWNGGTVLLYTSPVTSGSSPPSAVQAPGITDGLARTGTGTDQTKTQRVITIQASDAQVPTCGTLVSGVAPPPVPPACSEPLTIYSDVSDLPKADGDQLIEYTLGARNINSEATRKINGNIAYTLDTANVDFDVSYVNSRLGPRRHRSSGQRSGRLYGHASNCRCFQGRSEDVPAVAAGI